MTDRTIAALFVEEGGCYYGLDDVEPWGVSRDARKYDGPFPVVAHPPCARWGSLWFGGFDPRTERRQFGDDNGCFKFALEAVRKYGGVIEHPARSGAFGNFGISKPDPKGGWRIADTHGGFTCRVDQIHYGHKTNKPTILYVCNASLINLIWGEGSAGEFSLTDNPSQKMARHNLPFYPGMKKDNPGDKGRPKKLSTKQKMVTPPAFRNLLINIARSVYDKPEPPIRTLFAMPDPVPLKNPLGTVVDLDSNVDSS